MDKMIFSIIFLIKCIYSLTELILVKFNLYIEQCFFDFIDAFIPVDNGFIPSINDS